jgi:hypothetical protein
MSKKGGRNKDNGRKHRNEEARVRQEKTNTDSKA